MNARINDIPEQYREDLDKALRILKAEGCTEVYLFGSLAEGRFNEGSDIDLAVKGCPKGKFFKILGKLLMELNHSVDLIDLDRKNDFVKHIEQEGTLLYVQ